MIAPHLFIEIGSVTNSGSFTRFESGVLPALWRLQDRGFQFVLYGKMEDGAMTETSQALEGQGIVIRAMEICVHSAEENCDCRPPKTGLFLNYLKDRQIDWESSLFVGRNPNVETLARSMDVVGYSIEAAGWAGVFEKLAQDRSASERRKTKETDISVDVFLDGEGRCEVETGIGFLNHMIEQIAKHGGIDLKVLCIGDLQVDEHHTVEDVAITLGTAVRKALGNKRGIERFSFLLPMDEAECQMSMDLCGRAFLKFEGDFKREVVGDLPTEMVSHFFRSFSEAMQATIHLKLQGENTHHMVESCFKTLGRCLRVACRKTSNSIPSTKGVL